MKRVLLVSATAKRGGAERSLASLAHRLPGFGWAPLTALLESGPLQQWLEGTEVHRLDAGASAAAIADLARDCEVVVSNKWRGHVYGGPVAARGGLP